MQFCMQLPKTNNNAAVSSFIMIDDDEQSTNINSPVFRINCTIIAIRIHGGYEGSLVRKSGIRLGCHKIEVACSYHDEKKGKSEVVFGHNGSCLCSVKCV